MALTADTGVFTFELECILGYLNKNMILCIMYYILANLLSVLVSLNLGTISHSTLALLHFENHQSIPPRFFFLS